MRRTVGISRALLALALLLAWSATAAAADLYIKAGRNTIRKRVMSVKELRYKNIVRQRTDFSCGAASLATIMKYFYNDTDVSEDEIVAWLLSNGDVEQIGQRGFSLLDLKIYAESAGYKAEGYKIKAKDLPKLRIPTIVLLNTRGYTHFVVLKGVANGKAYIADPALGKRNMPVGEFLEAWNELIFVVYGKDENPDYDRFGGYASVDKDNVWRLNDLMMRNLFMNRFEL